MGRRKVPPVLSVLDQLPLEVVINGRELRATHDGPQASDPFPKFVHFRTSRREIELKRIMLQGLAESLTSSRAVVHRFQRIDSSAHRAPHPLQRALTVVRIRLQNPLRLEQPFKNDPNEWDGPVHHY